MINWSNYARRLSEMWGGTFSAPSSISDTRANTGIAKAQRIACQIDWVKARALCSKNWTVTAPSAVYPRFGNLRHIAHDCEAWLTNLGAPETKACCSAG